MKKREPSSHLWTSTRARLLGVFLIIAPCAVGLAACGDEEGDKPGTWQDAGELCGNGAIDEGEQCDGTVMPENAPAGATCKADCSGWSVSTSPVCGNGVIEDGEACDGAALPNDAPAGATCKADCSGWDVPTASVCGNDMIEDGEACDGAALPNDAPEGATCKADCSGWDVPTASVCGNGVIDGDEECDGTVMPANAHENAQCASDCTIVKCGNGVIDEGEACDPNAALPDDAPAGSECLDTCEIKRPDCGNGSIDKGEECDFNSNNNAQSLVVPPYGPEQCLPNCTLKICGNNRIDGDEKCDFDKEADNKPVFPPDVTVLEDSICTDECEIDQCPENENKTDPEPICGCHELTDDKDSDKDGTPDCIDACPYDKRIQTESQKNGCLCGETKIDNACYRNIDTAQDLSAYRDDWNNPRTTTTPNAILRNDINLADLVDFRPGFETSTFLWDGFKNYKGIFDGNGKTIVFQGRNIPGLFCTTSPCGLFSSTNNATIKNLKVGLNMFISLRNKLTKTELMAGLLVGNMTSGTLENVHVKGNLTHPSAADAVTPLTTIAGGLVGNVTNGTIFDASSTGTVNIELSPTNQSSVGGLIGSTNGKTYNVWSSSEVRQNGTTKATLGGLIGTLDDNANLLNAYALGNVALSSSSQLITKGAVGGLIGYTGNNASVINVYAFGAVVARSTTRVSDNKGYLVGEASPNTPTIENPSVTSTRFIQSYYYLPNNNDKIVGNVEWVGHTDAVREIKTKQDGADYKLEWDSQTGYPTIVYPLHEALNLYFKGPNITCTLDEAAGTCTKENSGEIYRLWKEGALIQLSHETRNIAFPVFSTLTGF